MDVQTKNIPVSIDDSVQLNRPKSYNKYYMKIASWYGCAKWITLLLFILYLLWMLLANRTSITHENFVYLLRDLNVKSGSVVYDSVVYDEQQNMVFSVYRDVLVVAGTSGIQLYDGAGSQVLSESITYQSPVIESGDKYMLVYDAAGKQFSVFTTIARVFSASVDGIIQCASISDSGSFAIVYRCSESKYAVSIYNTAFLEIARFYRDAYISDVAFSADGKRFALLEVSSVNWDVRGEMVLCSVNGEEFNSSALGSNIPLQCEYMENGNIAVVTDRCILVTSGDGELLSTYTLASMALQNFDISDNKIVIACASNVLGTEARVVVLDSACQVIYEDARREKILHIAASNGETSAYIVYDNTVELLHPFESRELEYTGTILSVQEIGGMPLLCFPSGAGAVFGDIKP